MRIKPIPMSVGSVRKIRNHLKIETRRVITPQPVYHTVLSDSLEWKWKGRRHSTERLQSLCPFQIGGLLWIRESLIKGVPPFEEALYESDGMPVRRKMKAGPKFEYIIWKWKYRKLPSRYMPGYAARTYLRLTDRSVERLHAINKTGIIKEGFPSGDRWEFKEAWDALNRERGYGWNTDPWNWVLNFVWEEQLENADLKMLKSGRTPTWLSTTHL